MTPENLRRLKDAKKLLGQVLDTLNTTAHECPNCGHEQREDYDQFCAHNELGAAMTRLTKWINIYEEGAKK